MRFQTMLAGLALAATLPFAIHESALAADPTTDDDLVGIEVTGVHGEELGQIVSVAPAERGSDATVLVEASGMLDVGHRFFTVHRSQLAPGEDVDTVTYKKTAKDVIRAIRNDSQVAER
ncbi:hypothetical protein [Azospirillum picis]|uniref:PRC-barrel domain-containing protein n=1 Tax=Azospirillum picis TaxID=488438 RepID=A0ABU0MIJ0_9PROT|nr:hypothetical protein [Azospirillum picis]MBP2299598.1 hypothetical protein [Azospirillum picis]MDQ0533275.1 hypothetical protein [Azospirillum picis]